MFIDIDLHINISVIADGHGVLIKCHSWDMSYIHKKIFWCYFKEGVLVSLHEKAGANLRIYKKTRIYMKELKDR